MRGNHPPHETVQARQSQPLLPAAKLAVCLRCQSLLWREDEATKWREQVVARGVGASRGLCIPGPGHVPAVTVHQQFRVQVGVVLDRELGGSSGGRVAVGAAWACSTQQQPMQTNNDDVEHNACIQPEEEKKRSAWPLHTWTWQYGD